MLGVSILVVAGLLLQEFSPPELASFDGRSWGGVVLGVDTDASINRRFKTRKSTIRPEAIQVFSERGFEIHVLLSGRGGNAKAVGFHLRGRPDRSGLPALPANLTPLYPTLRYEPWWIRVDRERGLVGITTYDAGIYSDEQILLVPPELLREVTRSWTSVPSEISAVPDPGKGWDRKLSFGAVAAGYRTPSNDPANTIKASKEYIVSLRAAELLRMSPGPFQHASESPAEITVSSSSDEFDDEGFARFEATMEAIFDTPYGRVRIDVSARRSMHWSDLEGPDALSVELIQSAIRNADLQLRNMNPPSPQSLTRDQIRLLIQALAPFEFDGATKMRNGLKKIGG